MNNANNTSKTLLQIKKTVKQNYVKGLQPYTGLTSSEIGDYNRSLMFGDNDEAFPSQEEWSRTVD